METQKTLLTGCTTAMKKIKMATINDTLNKGNIEFLKSLKGSVLKSTQGYFLFDNPDLYTDVLRLNVKDKNFNITCKYKNVNFGKDNTSMEEFATFGISLDEEEIWLPSGTK